MYNLAIIVKPLPAKGSRGRRIKATIPDLGTSATIGWEHAVSDTENADNAVRQLLARVNPSRQSLVYVRGCIPGGWVYVAAEWSTQGELTYPTERIAAS